MRSVVRRYEKAKAMPFATSSTTDADKLSQTMYAKALFTPEFFHARAEMGSDARDPILVVGLPRSGSTLIEQILSSHSQVKRHDGIAGHHDHRAQARRAQKEK